MQNKKHVFRKLKTNLIIINSKIKFNKSGCNVFIINVLISLNVNVNHPKLAKNKNKNNSRKDLRNFSKSNFFALKQTVNITRYLIEF